MEEREPGKLYVYAREKETPIRVDHQIGVQVDRDSPGLGPVDLQIGPDKRLYYVDHSGGTIRRFDYSTGNQPPTAAAIRRG